MRCALCTRKPGVGGKEIGGSAALQGLGEQFPDRAMVTEIDVTDRSAVFAGVSRALARFGRLDVIAHEPPA